MLKYIIELIGTFIFLSVIMVAVNSKIKWAFVPIGLALSLMIFWGGSVSGGHFNPAVSAMFFTNGQLSFNDLLIYIPCQLIGGMLALMYFKQVRPFLSGN